MINKSFNMRLAIRLLTPRVGPCLDSTEAGTGLPKNIGISIK